MATQTATRRETYEDLLAQIGEKNARVNAIFDKADDEGREIVKGDTDWESVVALNKEIEALERKAADTAEGERMRQSARERQKRLDAPVTDITHPGSSAVGAAIDAAGGRGNVKEGLTLGQRFLQSKSFREWYANLASSESGVISEKVRLGNSPPVGFKHLLAPIGQKALVTGLSDTSAGAFVSNDTYGYVQTGRRPLTVRDIITNGQTGSDTVEYVRETSATNAAAPVAEATAVSGTTGTKPESAIAYEKVTTTVKTIAHWVPATKRALADAGQVRTLVDAFLRYGLEEELEDQIVAGAGTGENFTGIANTTGITAQAWDTNILTTTRKARTKVRVTGRAQATAYLLHPTDWETIDLLQDNEARYFFGGPSVLGSPRLWGLPVVESEGCTAGEGYCADFRTVVVWDREDANIQVSDSHADFFIRNMVAILAEMRAAMGVLRPAAIVEMDLTA